MNDERPIEPAFLDEVRQMLQRRAADVPETPPIGRPQPPDRRDEASVRPASGRGDDAEVLTLPGRDVGLAPTDPATPWTRRAGLLTAVAAVVLGVAGFGLVTWWNDDPQQVAVGSAAAPAQTVLLPPEGDEVEVASFEIWTDADLGDADWLETYGPADGDPEIDGIVVLSQLMLDGNGNGGLMEGPDRVAAEQSEVLSELGATTDGRFVSWAAPNAGPDGGTQTVAVISFGQLVSPPQLFAVAEALALAAGDPLDEAVLPEGWIRTARVEGAGLATSVNIGLTGGLTASLTIAPIPLPTGVFGGFSSDLENSSERVELRGTTGLLVTTSFDGVAGGGPDIVQLIWNEGGANHQLMSTASGTDPGALLALARRLVPVDVEVARQRHGAVDEAAAVATTVVESSDPPSTPTHPQTHTTAPPVPLEPPVSMTAPGPGDVGRPPDSTTATTTGGIETTTPGTATTVVTTIPVVTRPNGDFTDNSIVPVSAASLGGVPYEVGISWSPTFGLCLGVDLDGALTEGGYPVACEVSPWIGGGGRRELPGVGTVVFAFAATDLALARAELVVDGQVNQAEILRVDEFPDFDLLLFALDGVPAEVVDELQLPGAIVLLDGAGQPLGWG